MKTKMNRYWLFENNDYEAGEVLDDLTYTFKTIKRAKAYVEERSRACVGGWRDNAFIVDSKDWKVISHRRRQAKWKETIDAKSYAVGEPELI